MPKPRRRAGATSNVHVIDPQHHATPLPTERVRESPMAYDPGSGQIVAPWPRGTITEEDEQALIAVLDQIAACDLRVPVWLRTTGDRAPVPIDADNPRTWFARWGENRAVYRDRKVSRTEVTGPCKCRYVATLWPVSPRNDAPSPTRQGSPGTVRGCRSGTTSTCART
jgi:hypothetical protein